MRRLPPVRGAASGYHRVVPRSRQMRQSMKSAAPMMKASQSMPKRLAASPPVGIDGDHGRFRPRARPSTVPRPFPARAGGYSERVSPPSTRMFWPVI